MDIDLAPEQISQLLQGVNIPPQPQIMVDLQMEQLQPEIDYDHVIKLITQDVGLAGSILKTVNSPFFGHKNSISSITQAIDLLGVKSVINIINALSIKGKLSDEAIIAMTNFWDTTTDIAMVSISLAKQIGFDSPDESYTLGLFHNCGIPLLLEKFRDYQDVLAKAYEQKLERITEIENQYFQTNHCVVGYYIARSWNLPLHICEAIAEHHNVEKMFSDEDNTPRQKKNLLAILKMAEHICSTYYLLGKQNFDNEWDRIADGLLSYVGLCYSDYTNIKDGFHEMGVGYSH